MSAENRNKYGFTKAEVKEKIKAMQERNRIEKLLEEQKEIARWNNFLDSMCGTGIIRKTY